MFFSTSFYINLNSYNLIELSTYIKLISLFFFFETLMLFFIEERDYKENSDEKPEGLIDTFKKMKKIITNKNVLTFVFLLLFSKVGNVFSGSILDLVLIENGMSEKVYANINTIFIPFRIVVSYYFSDIKGKYLSLFMKSYKNLIYIFILEYLYLMIFLYISSINSDLFFKTFWDSGISITIIVAIWIGKCYIWENYFSVINGFFNQIVDKEIGATYITTLNSFNNLSEKWPGIFVYYFVDLLGFKIIGILSIVYCILYYLIVKGKFEKLENLNESEWMIKQKTQ